MEEKDNPDNPATALENEPAPAEAGSTEASKSELSENIWSVVTFGELAASGLTYQDAAQKMAQLSKENVSGLCIITDEAASRIGK